MVTRRRGTVAVGLDIDGVLCDHVHGLCRRVSQQYGVSLTPDMICEWDFDFGPSSVARELEGAYGDDEFILSLPTVEGAPDAVAFLAGAQGLSLAAVTSRPLRTQVATRRWLQQHFPALALIHTPRKEESPIDVLVDDFPGFVEKFAAAGKRGVLFSRPWNLRDQERLRMVPRITVAPDWAAIVALVTSLAQGQLLSGE